MTAYTDAWDALKRAESDVRAADRAVDKAGSEEKAAREEAGREAAKVHDIIKDLEGASPDSPGLVDYLKKALRRATAKYDRAVAKAKDKMEDREKAERATKAAREADQKALEKFQRESVNKVAGS